MDNYKWTTELVLEFAKQYRFSSPRISIENFMAGKHFPIPTTPVQAELLIPNLEKSTENLSKIKDKDKWLREIRGDDIPPDKRNEAIEFSKWSSVNGYYRGRHYDMWYDSAGEEIGTTAELYKLFSPNEQGERKFSLKEALEIWESGANWYEDNEDYIKFKTVEPKDRNEYFKEKFGIDLEKVK